MRRIFSALCLLIACNQVSSQQGSTCRVVGVSDGDTVTVLCQENHQLKIRLAEIDAPEKAQPFGQRSRQSLSSICFDTDAEVYPVTTDRYGRTVARLMCNGVNANAHQVSTGMAWVYDRYAKDPALYDLQDSARASGRGLWSDTSPAPPWEWRKARR